MSSCRQPWIVLRSSERAGRKKFTTGPGRRGGVEDEVLESKPGDKNPLGGGGRRALTLRARVRAAKQYLWRLAVAADVSFPSEVLRPRGPRRRWVGENGPRRGASDGRR